MTELVSTGASNRLRLRGTKTPTSSKIRLPPAHSPTFQP